MPWVVRVLDPLNACIPPPRLDSSLIPGAGVSSLVFEPRSRCVVVKKKRQAAEGEHTRLECMGLGRGCCMVIVGHQIVPGVEDRTIFIQGILVRVERAWARPRPIHELISPLGGEKKKKKARSECAAWIPSSMWKGERGRGMLEP